MAVLHSDPISGTDTNLGTADGGVGHMSDWDFLFLESNGERVMGGRQAALSEWRGFTADRSPVLLVCRELCVVDGTGVVLVVGGIWPS